MSISHRTRTGAVDFPASSLPDPLAGKIFSLLWLAENLRKAMITNAVFTRLWGFGAIFPVNSHAAGKIAPAGASVKGPLPAGSGPGLGPTLRDLRVCARRAEGRCANRSAVPAELLRLPGGALRDHDVDEGGAAVVHRLVEGALQVLRVLDKEALAAEGFHHPVVAGAVDQRVGLHVEHRVVRDLRHAGADAAVVQNDDLDRQVVAAQRLHLHAGEADRRISRQVDDRTVRVHDGGGDRLAEAEAHRAVGAGVEAGTGVGDVQLGEADIHRAGALRTQDRVLRHPGGDIAQGTEIVGRSFVVVDLRPNLRRVLLRL